jgi:hypothetical protein
VLNDKWGLVTSSRQFVDTLSSLGFVFNLNEDGSVGTDTPIDAGPLLPTPEDVDDDDDDDDDVKLDLNSTKSLFTFSLCLWYITSVVIWLLLVNV